MVPIRSLLQRYWKEVAGVVAAVALLLKLDRLVAAIREAVAVGLVPGGSGRFLLSAGWGWGLAIAAVALAASSLLCVRLAFEVHALQREQRTSAAITEKTLSGMMRAANRIAYQMYPLAERPPFAFEKVSRSYHVDANGDTRVTASYSIRAYERPLHFWTLWLAAEPEAPGVDFLDSLDFKIRDLAGEDRVAYLVRRNDSHRKEISVFFLPRISPEEPARTIVFSYTWPRMVQRLLLKGEEEFYLELDSRTPVSLLEYSIYFHPKLQAEYKLGCTPDGIKVGNELLEEVLLAESGARGWRYSVTNAPAGGFSYHLRVAARRR